MKSAFEVIHYDFKDRRDITIVPVADVHLGSKECRQKDFEKFLQTVKETEDVYLILAGDLINNTTRSCVANIFEETMRPVEQKRKMAEMLRPVKDRILCVTTGNHERRSVRDADDDPVYDIAVKLDLEDVYRPEMAFLHIQMGNGRQNHDVNPSYVIGVTHGAGGGGTTGASVNRSERFAGVIEGLDVLVTGHTHKPSITSPYRLVVNPSTKKVYMRETRVVVCTSWLDYGGYAMEKMMVPSGFVKQRIVLGGSRKRIEITTG